MSELAQERRDELIQRVTANCLRLEDCQDGPAQHDLKAELGELVEKLWLSEGAA